MSGLVFFFYLGIGLEDVTGYLYPRGCCRWLPRTAEVEATHPRAFRECQP